jgi:WhiB family redox-sensing transcriptional regulator
MAHSNWRERGLCTKLTPEQVDDLFFPSTGGKSAKAKKLCLRCPVSTQCSDAGLLGKEEFGLWGGIPASELRMTREDRIEKVEGRHPERLASYLECLPSVSRSYTSPDEIEFDELEHPLDSAS